MSKKQSKSNTNGAATGGTKSARGKNNEVTTIPPLDSKQAAIFKVKQQYKCLTGGAPVAQVSEDGEGDKPIISLATRRISFAELVRCACFPFATKSQKLMPVIKSNVSLYTQYEWVLGKLSFASSGEQVAASSDSRIMSRTTEYFDFQIRPDKSNSKQVHLLLSLKQTQANTSLYVKGVFLHCMLKNQFKVLHFENVLDGRAQIIIEKDSATYHLITSPNTKLYLC
ncbi:hypothetical protein [Glaciecola sp. 33A]|uniref:hypothetical protein n=1 Tax=Glaciecola sp. 33A TaxID=2057807 RepID=UPI000C343B5E|nr:hypothetical protein [Glaciecola sp. 33A]PKI02246.1 hypothetical protein CXF81_07980 [Glaciecola sp. 33A]